MCNAKTACQGRTVPKSDQLRARSVPTVRLAYLSLRVETVRVVRFCYAIFFLLFFVAMSLASLYRSTTASLYSLTPPHGTSLTIISSFPPPQSSINHFNQSNRHNSHFTYHNTGTHSNDQRTECIADTNDDTSSNANAPTPDNDDEGSSFAVAASCFTSRCCCSSSR